MCFVAFSNCCDGKYYLKFNSREEAEEYLCKEDFYIDFDMSNTQ